MTLADASPLAVAPSTAPHDVEAAHAGTPDPAAPLEKPVEVSPHYSALPISPPHSSVHCNRLRPYPKTTSSSSFPLSSSPCPSPLPLFSSRIAHLCIYSFLAAMDQTIVATAVPSIVADIGGGTESSSSYTWIGTAYLLMAACLSPLCTSSYTSHEPQLTILVQTERCRIFGDERLCSTAQF